MDNKERLIGFVFGVVATTFVAIASSKDINNALKTFVSGLGDCKTIDKK